jgi:hypothetical protein
MKKTALFAAFAALVIFTSCNKETSIPSVSSQEVSIDVSVISGVQATKASGDVNTTMSEYHSSAEQTVNNLQVFVFSDDVLDGYASVNNAMSTSVECTAGTRIIYCLINAPVALGDIVSKTALLDAVSELEENPSNFEMMGFKEEEIIAGGNNEIEVPVSRLASKIVIKGIENALKTGGDLKVTRVYITNVAGQVNYGLDVHSPAEGKWYNKGGYQASNNLGAFTQDIGLSSVVANGSKYETDHYFYAYPNDNAQANHSATWSPKRTMLVVQIEYDGRLYDYPVDLGVNLEPNKMYVLNNLKLVNLGNADDGEEGGADEEDPVTGSTTQVSVDIVDWNLVLLGDGGEITI